MYCFCVNLNLFSHPSTLYVPSNLLAIVIISLHARNKSAVPRKCADRKGFTGSINIFVCFCLFDQLHRTCLLRESILLNGLQGKGVVDLSVYCSFFLFIDRCLFSEGITSTCMLSQTNKNQCDI